LFDFAITSEGVKSCQISEGVTSSHREIIERILERELSMTLGVVVME